jgi:uncharacterized protein YndB with AHSA1/START domain
MKKLLFFSSVFMLGHLAAQSDSLHVNWPAAFAPEKTNFFVHNEIEINADPQKVWTILLKAKDWPAWYSGAEDVNFGTPADSVLTASTVFTWKTMGLNFVSTVKEFVPAQRLSWQSDKKSIQGYHAWLIIPTAKGCKLITEESQKGWLTFFEKTFQPRKLFNLHQYWLELIKQKAESTH